MKKTKKKRKLKIKLLLKLFLGILIIGAFVYYVLNLPIKNIYINGNNYLNDAILIKEAGIKDYPPLFKYSSSLIKRKIMNLDMVSSCKIKKNLLGRITINIEEARPIFYNRNESKYVLSNGKTTNNYNFVGIPFLINYVPNNIYKRLQNEFQKINSESLNLISEIEYSPSKSKDIIIDDTRFLLRMNDGNIVYVNLINIDRLNSYHLIYTALTEKGVLELDSDNENVVFKSFKSIANTNNVSSD